MENFHGEIAFPLEGKAREVMGLIDRPVGTIFDADSIETGTFAEVMILLLRKKWGYLDSEEVDAFVSGCAPYIQKYASEIPEEKTRSLYHRFKELFESQNS